MSGVRGGFRCLGDRRLRARVQAGGVSPHEIPLHARLVNTIGAVFAQVRSFVTHVPTFGTPWGFALAADQPFDDRLTPDTVDTTLRREGVTGLRMLDGLALHGLFCIPRHVRGAIAGESLVYTLAEPPRAMSRGESHLPAPPPR